MLIWFVILYLIISIGIGLYAVACVHNTRRLFRGRTPPAGLYSRGNGIRHPYKKTAAEAAVSL